MPSTEEQRQKTKHLSLVVFKKNEQKQKTKTKPWEVTDTVKE